MSSDKDQFDDSFEDDFEDDFMEDFDDDFGDDEDLSLDGHPDDDFEESLDEEPKVAEETADEMPDADDEFMSVDEEVEGETMWDDADGTSLDEEPKQKGSSKGLLVASIIAIAIAGGGYYAFTNMGSQFNIPALPSDMAETSPVAEYEEAQDDTTAVMAALPDPAEVLTPMPEVSMPVTEEGEEEFTELPMPEAIDNEELELPQAELPSPSLPKMADIMLKKNPEPVVEPAYEEPMSKEMERPSAVEMVDIKQSDEYLKAQREIEALKKSLVKTNDKVRALEQELQIEKSKPAEVVETVQSVDTSKFEKQISTQQELINASEREITELKSKLSALSQKHESLLSQAQSMERELMAKNKTISEQRKSIQRISQKPEPRITVRKPAQAIAEPSVDWVLRSVQPNIAWLSEKGENEMKRVEVGEVVKGLGTIRSIAIKDGIWVVEGSKGQVTQ